MSDEPQSTASWRIGAEGERQLAVRLNRELIECGVVLHDRNHPGTNGNIDHLVIAPSGVWIVDAKNYTGKVERRDKGGWFKSDDRLYVGGRDRTKLVAGLTWQVGHVQAVLEPVGFAAAPIHPVLCFIDADWAWFAKPIELDGVLIIWPGALCERILQPGDLEPGVIDILARELSSKLPAAKWGTAVHVQYLTMLSADRSGLPSQR